MAEERLDYDWNHTSSLMALVANCHRDPDSPPFTPLDFHPLRARTPVRAAISARDLKGIFLK
jgi:hypothetical protein